MGRVTLDVCTASYCNGFSSFFLLSFFLSSFFLSSFFLSSFFFLIFLNALKDLRMELEKEATVKVILAKREVTIVLKPIDGSESYNYDWANRANEHNT